MCVLSCVTPRSHEEARQSQITECSERLLAARQLLRKKGNLADQLHDDMLLLLHEAADLLLMGL